MYTTAEHQRHGGPWCRGYPIFKKSQFATPQSSSTQIHTAQQASRCRLQARAVDRLHVDGELTAAVVENENADGATARLEGSVETGPEVGLVNDGEVRLDVTGLGHGDDTAIVHVKDTVLLEDGAVHGLDDDAGLGVGDVRRLLVQLLGEEVDTKVAVLAGGSRGRDADHLAGAALKHQEVAHADVVAGNRHRVGQARALVAAAGAGTGRLADIVVGVDVLITAFGVDESIGK
ncbi:hypothetical protein HYQ46_006502 [Verticillium longisporum]|nr:hypothetical protein HYQ46_006502 [Verticillium longisporum]